MYFSSSTNFIFDAYILFIICISYSIKFFSTICIPFVLQLPENGFIIELNWTMPSAGRGSLSCSIPFLLRIYPWPWIRAWYFRFSVPLYEFRTQVLLNWRGAASATCIQQPNQRISLCITNHKIKWWKGRLASASTSNFMRLLKSFCTILWDTNKGWYNFTAICHGLLVLSGLSHHINKICAQNNIVENHADEWEP